MSMVKPELWAKTSNAALVLCYSHIMKYKHLLKWKNNESILEFGFASGHNSSRLLVPILPKDYKEFIGTDVSKEMVEDGKKKFMLPRSEIAQLDIVANVPKEFENRFDHIFGFFVMHLVKNPRKAFQNLYNMLKPGGTMFLTFLEKIPMDDMFDRLRQHPKWGKYGQEEMISTYYYSQNAQEDYKKDLEAAKFKDYLFYVENDFYKFTSEEEFDGFLTAVNVTLPKIPKEEYEEYLTKYLDEKNRSQSIKVSHENGGKNFMYYCNTCIVIATKPE